MKKKLIGIGPFTAKVNYDKQLPIEVQKALTGTHYPIPQKGQSAADFIKDEATKLVEMFAKPESFKIEKDGNNLYILDNIYDVWPDDEKKGKSAKTIAELVQHKIREYSRIHDEYEYKKAEYKFAGAGVMRVLFYFQKQINY